MGVAKQEDKRSLLGFLRKSPPKRAERPKKTLKIKKNPLKRRLQTHHQRISLIPIIETPSMIKHTPAIFQSVIASPKMKNAPTTAITYALDCSGYATLSGTRVKMNSHNTVASPYIVSPEKIYGVKNNLTTEKIELNASVFFSMPTFHKNWPATNINVLHNTNNSDTIFMNENPLSVLPVFHAAKTQRPARAS